MPIKRKRGGIANPGRQRKRSKKAVATKIATTARYAEKNSIFIISKIIENVFLHTGIGKYCNSIVNSIVDDYIKDTDKTVSSFILPLACSTPTRKDKKSSTDSEDNSYNFSWGSIEEFEK